MTRRTGIVQSADTHLPLSGVLVGSGGFHSYSDSAGRFSVRVTSDTALVTFQRLGYTTLALGADAVPAVVSLAPKPTLLDAIAVSSVNANDLGEGSALTTSLLRRSTIATRGGSSLAERMEGIEGISLQRMGEWGSRALLRGLGGERVTVMVDGARVNRACTFGMDQGLSTVDPATVERVEVLSGPGSTLYGSGNIGGVINVVTKRPAVADGWHGEFRAAGATATPGASVGASLALRRTRFDVSAAVDASDYSDYRAPIGRVVGSGYRDGTAALTFGVAPTPSQRLALSTSLYEGRDIGWPAMTGAAIPSERRHSVALDYGWQVAHPLVDALSARAFVQRLDHHMTIDMTMPMTSPTGMPMTMRSQTDARSHSITSGSRAQLRLVPTRRSHLDLGTDLTLWDAEATRWNETQRISSSGGAVGTPSTIAFRTWPGVRVSDLGLFGQGEFALTPRFSTTAGLRLDRTGRQADAEKSSTDWITTGNIGTRAALGGGFDARVSLGWGYRIADPTELYGLALRPDGFVYRGSPTLVPETNRNLEATLAFRTGRLWGGAAASVTVFRNELRNLISPRLALGDSLNGRPIREYANVSEALLQGISASSELGLGPRVRARSALTYVRGENLIASSPLAATPPLEGSLAIRLTPGAIHRWLEVEGRAAARQERFALDAGERVTPGYGVLNLRGGVTIASVQATVGIDNVLDRAYRAHVDPMLLIRPGRNGYLRLSRAF
ncbi:MAG: TonB-dependent receptor [Gemmatimonadaceae bacterium]|nr:TonB-dependent receptor [Gemmatimonadaceae bacterium]